DLELAAGRLVDVVGELLDVLGVVVVRGVGGGQVPLHLRGGRKACEREDRAQQRREAKGSGHRKAPLHGRSWAERGPARGRRTWFARDINQIRAVGVIGSPRRAW